MLLAVDVGNTHTRLALVRGSRILGATRMPTRPSRPAREYRDVVVSLARMHGGMGELTGACVASVVPDVDGPLAEGLEELPCHFARDTSNFSYTLDVEEPETVGADRLVNAEGALQMAEPPLIVVDVGTAITVCALMEGPRFLGGAIAPGLGIGAEALFSRGARLPEVPLVAPPSPIGRNTTEALQSGLVLGFMCLVEGLVERFREILGPKARVVSTGGGLRYLERSDRLGAQVPELTLKGLESLARREGLVDP